MRCGYSRASGRNGRSPASARAGALWRAAVSPGAGIPPEGDQEARVRSSGRRAPFRPRAAVPRCRSCASCPDSPCALAWVVMEPCTPC
eukprot:scaffold32703_cov54-Phaeocystis_antarctica.AAC.1